MMPTSYQFVLNLSTLLSLFAYYFHDFFQKYFIIQGRVNISLCFMGKSFLKRFNIEVPFLKYAVNLLKRNNLICAGFSEVRSFKSKCE